MRLDARLTLFLTLVGVFLTSLLLGNLVAGKVVQLPLGGASFAMSAGEIPFPLTFVLTDVLNEFYGKRVIRRVTLLGFAMTGLAFAMIHVAVAAPWVAAAHEPGWGGLSPSAFDAVFSGATRIQVASMCAFLTGQLVDITLFHLLRRATRGRMLWLRATGSTVVSQLLDTVLVTTIGFAGTVPDGVLVEMMGTSYLVKLGIAVALTPLIYGLHALLERRWGLAPVQVDDPPPG
jgi:hypothetical protein